MTTLLPLIPLLIAMIVVGGRIGWLTTRSFFALAKEMEEHGYALDRAQASDLLKKWQKKPARIVSDADSEELRAIKLAHASAFAARIRPWKIAARIATIGGAIGALVLYSYR